MLAAYYDGVHMNLLHSKCALELNCMYGIPKKSNFLFFCSRRYLAVKNLDDSSDTLHKIPRHSKYEVGAAEWNPSSINKELCAISVSRRRS